MLKQSPKQYTQSQQIIKQTPNSTQQSPKQYKTYKQLHKHVKTITNTIQTQTQKKLNHTKNI